ncbi:MAG TPA: YkgJ family cysteine cluster protein [Bryobacteraceae bacterium]|nr:YkgJ family cysteine cluster protein [Bryobacteraceae bacterium]
MLTDLVQIRRLGEKNRAENLRFRRWIKSHTFVERQFRRAAERIQGEIDCRACAECCRVTDVQLADRDVEHLARYLGLPRQRFLDDYTTLDAEGVLILRRTQSKPGTGAAGAACVFLDGNDCTVYDARPGNCERFPHLLRGAGSLESRMWEFADRATYCPIVFNWLEAVKDLTNFRK